MIKSLLWHIRMLIENSFISKNRALIMLIWYSYKIWINSPHSPKKIICPLWINNLKEMMGEYFVEKGSQVFNEWTSQWIIEGRPQSHNWERKGKGKHLLRLCMFFMYSLSLYKLRASYLVGIV